MLAFAFSWTAVATVSLHWNRETRPAGGDFCAALVLAAATLLVGAIAVRTVVALYRGTFFPRDAAAARRHGRRRGPLAPERTDDPPLTRHDAVEPAADAQARQHAAGQLGVIDALTRAGADPSAGCPWAPQT